MLSACSSDGGVISRAEDEAVTRPVALGAVAIVRRLRTDGAGRTPRLAGLDLPAAEARLRGTPVQTIRVGPGRRVTAQWPEAGEAATGVLTLWVGRPQAPPPPPVAKPELTPAPTSVAAAPAPRRAAPLAPAPAKRPAPTSQPDPAPTPTPSETAEERSPAPPTPSGLEPTGEPLQGRASWYGPGFEGNRTACGQRFDPGQLTLASRELDCGTVVRVTGPGGRTVEATVNDWGPAEWTERRFDLSRATFTAVASLSAGVIDVTVEPLR